jgi:hypothetical protein
MKQVADRISDLEKNGFDRMLPKGAKSVTAEAAVDPNAEPEVPTDLDDAPAASNSTVVATPSFDYLLRFWASSSSPGRLGSYQIIAHLRSLLISDHCL